MFDFRDEERIELENSSDRAAAIIGAAYIDSALETLIVQRTVYEGANKKDDRVVGRALESRGLLGSLGAKATIAYAFGFISLAVLRDIEVLAKIRNKFAHRNELKSFDRPEIQNLVNKLSVATVGARATELVRSGPVSARERFLFAAAEIATVLSRRRLRPEFKPIDWSV